MPIYVLGQSVPSITEGDALRRYEENQKKIDYLNPLLDSTVSIKVFDKKGSPLNKSASGVVVDCFPSTAGGGNNCAVMINEHLVRGINPETSISISFFKNGEFFRRYNLKGENILLRDSQKDLAMIGLQIPDYYKPVAVSSAEESKLNVGDALVRVGCPDGVPLPVCNLRMREFNSDGDLICSGSSPLGNSGGGLFNQNGEIVALCKSNYKEYKGEESAGYVPLVQINEFMKKYAAFKKKVINNKKTNSSQISSKPLEESVATQQDLKNATVLLTGIVNEKTIKHPNGVIETATDPFFGSGTIINCPLLEKKGGVYVLTARHVLDGLSQESKKELNILNNNKIIATPPFTIIGTSDKKSDLALVRFESNITLPKVSIATTIPVEGDHLIQIGFPGGALPDKDGNIHVDPKLNPKTSTLKQILNSTVARINEFEGFENITCSPRAMVGRSGGGLFNNNNELVGVCSFVPAKNGDTTTYTSSLSINQFLKKIGCFN